MHDPIWITLVGGDIFCPPTAGQICTNHILTHVPNQKLKRKIAATHLMNFLKLKYQNNALINIFIQFGTASNLLLFLLNQIGLLQWILGYSKGLYI